MKPTTILVLMVVGAFLIGAGLATAVSLIAVGSSMYGVSSAMTVPGGVMFGMGAAAAHKRVRQL